MNFGGGPRKLFHEPPELLRSGIVVLRRTSLRYTTATEIDRERLRLAHQLTNLGRAKHRLLVDSRAAPTDTDSALTAEFAKLRVSVRRGFDKIAVLVRTKVGVLHAGRLGAQDGAPEVIFDSEESAFAYLKAP